MGEFTVNSWAQLTGSRGDQLINGNVITAEDAEPQFPQFVQLPTELQDKIWSFCIPLLPRKVDVTDTDEYYPGPGRNKSVVMTGINKRTRTDTTTFYGYVRLQNPKVAISSFLFNPEVDILFLSHEDLRATRWTKTDVRKCLEAADVLGRVRCVALGADRGYHTGWMKHFKLYTALELVFVIINHLHIEAGSEVRRSRNRCGAHGMRLQTVERGSLAYTALKSEWGNLEEFRSQLQQQMVREDSRVAPNVVFVRQLHMHQWTGPFWYHRTSEVHCGAFWI